MLTWRRVHRRRGLSSGDPNAVCAAVTERQQLTISIGEHVAGELGFSVGDRVAIDIADDTDRKLVRLTVC